MANPVRRDDLIDAINKVHADVLEQLSDALGWGHLTGKARLVINDLTITQNHLTSLDAEIVVEPSSSQPKTSRANSQRRDCATRQMRCHIQAAEIWSW